MSAYLRAKRLGISINAEDGASSCQSRVNRYLTDIAGKDDRRMAWNFERAAEALSLEIDNVEMSIMSAAKFSDQGETEELTKKRACLLQDFEFLYCMALLFKLRTIDRDTTKMAEAFGINTTRKK